MLTASDSPTDQVQGLDRGANDYVTRPFSLEVLVARVRAHLRRREGDQADLLSTTCSTSPWTIRGVCYVLREE